MPRRDGNKLFKSQKKFYKKPLTVLSDYYAPWVRGLIDKEESLSHLRREKKAPGWEKKRGGRNRKRNPRRKGGFRTNDVNARQKRYKR